MTTMFSEGPHAGEALVSEANGKRSREVVTIVAGAYLPACTILGKTAAGLAAAATAAAGNGGNGAMGAITVGACLQLGSYMLRITKAAANAGDFEVTDPEGAVIGVGTVGIPFSAGGLGFTLADGAADFVAGDSFAIAVTGAPKYAGLDPAATDGSQLAAGMLIWPAAAADADVKATAIVRDAEINGLAITWPAGITADQKAGAVVQLAEIGIIVRS